jgi:hypothetical protein
VLYLVSLRDQQTTFSLGQLYRSCTEKWNSIEFLPDFVPLILKPKWSQASVGKNLPAEICLKSTGLRVAARVSTFRKHEEPTD